MLEFGNIKISGGTALKFHSNRIRLTDGILTLIDVD
jgi:hypothetical protein